MSKVPSDPNISPEMRRYLDDVSRLTDRLSGDVDDLTTFPGFASQAEAEAGTATDKALNALRTAQAIVSLNQFVRFVHVRDEQAANTAGGTFTTGAWRTRVLNTVARNNLSGSSLASNQLTLPAGSFYVQARAPAYQVNRHKTRLRNITGGATLIEGSTSYAPGEQTDSVLSGYFTLSVSSAVELQHQCETTNADDGFGIESNFGVVEVYAEMTIWRTA